VSVLITASAIRTCLGDGEATFRGLLHGTSGLSELRYAEHVRPRVRYGYHIVEDGAESLFRASRWLTACVHEALKQSGLDGGKYRRIIALVGTGLRELRAVERAAVESLDFPTERLHFADAVRQASPHIREVITISNACSAGGHALALAQDMLELGEADAVLVAAADAMTESMLAMIGRFADAPTNHLRPFDVERAGVLLGDGAAALVVVPEGSSERSLARLLSVGLSCDATHETAPDPGGIRRAMKDALSRAGRTPAQVDLVIAHGTGTALNDPTEAELIRQFLDADVRRPLITAVKGALGHTSGSAALMSVDAAMRCLSTGWIPAIVGLRCPLDEGRGMGLVMGEPVEAHLHLAQINAFGFGGVNAVTLIEAVA
jgi:3-oxoacyl-[acyl-carrier-protein] synthase II